MGLLACVSFWDVCARGRLLLLLLAGFYSLGAFFLLCGVVYIAWFFWEYLEMYGFAGSRVHYCAKQVI